MEKKLALVAVTVHALYNSILSTSCGLVNSHAYIMVLFIATFQHFPLFYLVPWLAWLAWLALLTWGILSKTCFSNAQQSSRICHSQVWPSDSVSEENRLLVLFHCRPEILPSTGKHDTVRQIRGELQNKSISLQKAAPSNMVGYYFQTTMKKNLLKSLNILTNFFTYLAIAN